MKTILAEGRDAESDPAAGTNAFVVLTKRAAGRRLQPFLTSEDAADLTFGELLDQAARVQSWLALKSVGRGDRVLVQVEKSLPSIVLYLGCLRAGAVFIPLNAAYGDDEVGYFLGDSDPALAVATAGTALSRIADAGRCVILPDDLALSPWRSSGLDVPPAASEADDPAAILYTSGTTGRSKGAILTQRNLTSNALVLQEAWGWRDGDVLLHALPTFHAHGLFVALHGALLNASTILFHRNFDPDRVLRDLPRSTVFMGVPTFYTRLLDQPALDRELCRSMRLFVCGSAPLLPATFADFEKRTGHAVLERYGMTEALMVTSNPYGGPRLAGAVGRPLPGIGVRIVADGVEAPCGRPGMLQVKGPNVFAGYWRNPEKTAQEFTPDGYFISGDVATRDEEGVVRIVGRDKDLIISGGYNVYPKEIEVAIDAIEGVAESAVVGVPHPDFGEGVVALVVLRAASAVAPDEITSILRQRLAPFKRPKQVIIVDDLPRNALGKIQKTALRARYARLFAGGEHPAPDRTATA